MENQTQVLQNQMQIFHNTEFGALDVLMVDDKPYFPAKECAEILGYSKPRNAIERHCKGVIKRGVLTNGGIQAKTYIPEGDLYRLIVRSKLPAAQRFESFVCDEVLPSIRKHGAYITDDTIKGMLNDPEYNRSILYALIKEQNNHSDETPYITNQK